ncbi:uncharacterized protein LTR77_007632 [Saxophila tyrrhenica]|uniref:SIS domain-containing protein n=1 Tax=Saxophila tyrrhenica TaxID=1690608 RepID=A0AAV9P6N4_9PEZI|nr:hypothetical protein LTR77_007632 [Saxophila tyrrhenica]
MDHCESASTKLLDSATAVLGEQAAALSHVHGLYQTDETARRSLAAAVDAIVQAQARRGKLIVCGVGKSAYVGMKLVATCKSLGIAASFMHACEAVHGDLGDIREDDVLLFISYSGKTPELLNLRPHIPQSTRVMVVTSQSRPEDCLLLADREDGILIQASIHKSEEESFGVSAPTTSATVALAISDMLALTVAGQIHADKRKEVFKWNHPGGAIGMRHEEVEALKEKCLDVSIVELPSPSLSAQDEENDSKAI